MADNLGPRTYKNLPGVQVFDADHIADHIENWKGRAIIVSREVVRDIGSSRAAGSETVKGTLRKPGLYIIWAPSGARRLPKLYVGYGGNCLHRLKDHDKKKPFWTDAAVLTSRIKMEGDRHRRRRRWLEAELLNLALRKQSEGLCNVDNENRAEHPDLTMRSVGVLNNMVDGFLVCLSHVGLGFLRE